MNNCKSLLKINYDREGHPCHIVLKIEAEGWEIQCQSHLQNEFYIILHCMKESKFFSSPQKLLTQKYNYDIFTEWSHFLPSRLVTFLWLNQLIKKELTCAFMSWGIKIHFMIYGLKSWQQLIDTEARTAENSHLEPHVGSRERKLGMACGF